MNVVIAIGMPMTYPESETYFCHRSGPRMLNHAKPETNIDPKPTVMQNMATFHNPGLATTLSIQ